MKDKHIIDVLDNRPILSLAESELSEIQVHVRDCVSCREAYEAARVSAIVLQSRAQVTIEPSPFFQTRVMAAWREKQALVSTMAVTTAALAVLSFMMPATPAVDQTVSAMSAESVIMGQASDEQMSYEQVLATIYEDEDEAR
jgi:hypothetical protein